eukprot:4924238-Prymnesium_polylepis.2
MSPNDSLQELWPFRAVRFDDMKLAPVPPSKAPDEAKLAVLAVDVVSELADQRRTQIVLHALERDHTRHVLACAHRLPSREETALSGCVAFLVLDVETSASITTQRIHCLRQYCQKLRCDRLERLAAHQLLQLFFSSWVLNAFPVLDANGLLEASDRLIALRTTMVQIIDDTHQPRAVYLLSA